MTLETFYKELNANQVSKGRDYFHQGVVRNLKDRKRGLWSAVVRGSEVYDVEVKLSKNAIVSTSCDCPHDVTYCKHVIAVLFALKEAKSQGKAGGPDTDLERHLNAYAGLIKKVLKEDERRAYEYENDYSTAPLDRDLNNLLEKAKSDIAEKQYAIAAGLSLALIDGVGHMFGYMDRSGVVAYDCSKIAFKLLHEICCRKIPATLQEHIFRFVLDRVGLADFEGDWYTLALRTAHNAAVQNILLIRLDELQSSQSKANEMIGTTKVLLLRKMGRSDEAEVIRNAFPFSYNMYEMIAEDEIQKENFDEALRIVKEGKARAEAGRYINAKYKFEDLLSKAEAAYNYFKRSHQKVTKVTPKSRKK